MPLCQSTTSVSDDLRIGSDDVWHSIKTWATSVLLQRSDSTYSITALKISLVDTLVRVAWEAIAVRCRGQSTVTEDADNCLDFAIVQWLLKTLHAAPRRLPCDAMLVRNALNQCASLVLDDGFGGNSQEAINEWEYLLSEVALLCIVMINNGIHSSTESSGVVPLELLSTLTRSLSAIQDQFLGLAVGFGSVVTCYVKKSKIESAEIFAGSNFGML